MKFIVNDDCRNDRIISNRELRRDRCLMKSCSYEIVHLRLFILKIKKLVNEYDN